MLRRRVFGRPLNSPNSTIRFSSPIWTSPSSGCWLRQRSWERIIIHGDYDVDGITSTVTSWRRVLEMIGADVSHFVPERLRDGLRPAAGDD